MDTDERPDLRRGGESIRITKLRVGLILNFKNARLEFERVVL
jgi:hypothetical protein